MKNATREEKFQVVTSIGDRSKWSKCCECGQRIDGVKMIKTFRHGQEVTVCKDCIKKLRNVEEATDKATSKGLTYMVEIITLTDICKAYLLVNGYAHTTPNVWKKKSHRFSAPRKIIDELTKTTAYGACKVNVYVYKLDKMIGFFEGVKDADVVKEFTDNIK
jgi:hypothetical protein